jgi:hypothetical protein
MEWPLVVRHRAVESKSQKVRVFRDRGVFGGLGSPEPGAFPSRADGILRRGLFPQFPIRPEFGTTLL